MEQLNIIWGPIRALLQSQFNFGDIKEILGLAGVDLTKLSHMQQSPTSGSSKSQLMTATDAVYASISDKRRFLTITTEEVLSRKPEVIEQLQDYLTRLGWKVHNGSLVPIEILDLSDLPELPTEAHPDLVKAAPRLRDGDLSGAISAACGAVDAVTSVVYDEESLGDPGGASFQERVVKSLRVRGALPTIESDLAALGWNTAQIKPFKENLHKSLNDAAYVMQTLRSRMGDVHGTKPILKPLVFDSLKWASLIVRLLHRS